MSDIQSEENFEIVTKTPRRTYNSEKSKFWNKKYYLKKHGVDVSNMTDEEILNYKLNASKRRHNFDEETYIQTRNRLNHVREYLRNKLGLDTKSMSVEEILNYEIKRGPPRKYSCEEERQAYIKSMKTVYNKRYNEQQKVKDYFRNYYRDRCKALATCPHCGVEIKSKEFQTHIEGNPFCKDKENEILENNII